MCGGSQSDRVCSTDTESCINPFPGTLPKTSPSAYLLQSLEKNIDPERPTLLAFPKRWSGHEAEEKAEEKHRSPLVVRLVHLKLKQSKKPVRWWRRRCPYRTTPAISMDAVNAYGLTEYSVVRTEYP